MTWDEAYLQQARSDWEVHNIAEQCPVAACHCLHYLQMTTEKLAKAGRLRAGDPLQRVRTSHKGFVRFLQLAARNQTLAQALQMRGKDLGLQIQGSLHIADQIELLAPNLAKNGPNPEYPWETSGRVVAPMSYCFPLSGELRSPQGRRLLKLISFLLADFDRFF